MAATAVAPEIFGAAAPVAATLPSAVVPAGLPTDLSMPVVTPTGYDFPSSKLGQLLGFKGLTIQKVKEVSGVTRLHIHDKEKAKMQATIPIEVAGTAEQISHCTRILEAICTGDQTELGHLTTYVNIEPGVVGKCMGYKGTTVKQMTEVTGCYIEIQQDRSKGPNDTPRLFIAGKPDAVDNAVALINRFIASPGSKLDAVLGDTAVVPAVAASPSVANAAAQLSSLAASAPGNLVEALQPLIAALIGNGGNTNPQTLQQNLAAMLQGSLPATVDGGGELSVFEADGPKEERIIEVPARKKGHLLGLHGQTIEKIRQTSGVIKCHIMADRGRSDKEGNIQVQIFGTREHVEACEDLVVRVVAGDHTGIGHSSAFLPVEASKVNRLRGDHWQVINALKDLTSTYLDILQGPQAGLQTGEAQLFIAGPPDCVERAKAIVTTLLGMMDHVPATGEISPEALGTVLNALMPVRSTQSKASAPAPAPAAPTFTPSSSFTASPAPVAAAPPLETAARGSEGLAGLIGSLAQLSSSALKQAPSQQQAAAQQVVQLAGQYLEQLTGSKGALQDAVNQVLGSQSASAANAPAHQASWPELQQASQWPELQVPQPMQYSAPTTSHARQQFGRL